jgi:hypothetical protein
MKTSECTVRLGRAQPATALAKRSGLNPLSEELFGAARFELTRVLPTPSAFGIVEARPV